MVAAASPSHSTAARTSYPARSAPRSSPPAPENSEIAMPRAATLTILPRRPVRLGSLSPVQALADVNRVALTVLPHLDEVALGIGSERGCPSDPAQVVGSGEPHVLGVAERVAHDRGHGGHRARVLGAPPAAAEAVG